MARRSSQPVNSATKAASVGGRQKNSDALSRRLAKSNSIQTESKAALTTVTAFDADGRSGVSLLERCITAWQRPGLSMQRKMGSWAVRIHRSAPASQRILSRSTTARPIEKCRVTKPVDTHTGKRPPPNTERGPVILASKARFATKGLPILANAAVALRQDAKRSPWFRAAVTHILDTRRSKLGVGKVSLLPT